MQGHSNFRTAIKKKQNGYIFCKTAKGTNFQRLYNQCMKQEQYEKMIGKDYIGMIIEVPHVVGKKKTYNSFQFCMEYYNGKNILDIIESSDILSLDAIIDNVFSFIEWEFDNCQKVRLDGTIFEKKIMELKPKLDGNIIPLVEELEKKKFKKEIIYINVCHGDLTFSNMILSNKMVLFDFLDTYFESPLQDISKILQEINLKWALQMSNPTDVTKINIGYSYLKDKANEKIGKIIKKYSINPELLEMFYKMTLLRLFPYVREKRIYDLILGEIK